MKLIKKSISEKDGQGMVVLVPEIPEDMWHIYNLMVEGDVLRAQTYRKIVSTTSTGSSSSEKKRISLTLKVEDVAFEPKESHLRVKGRNITESQYVKMGAYHTIDLELHRKFSLTKSCWDIIFLERLEIACDVAKVADLAAIVMQQGLAYLCLITSHMTVTKAKIEQVVPRKRRGSSSQHEKALTRFYEAVLQAIIRHVDFDVVKCMLIASPGFVNESFLKYIFSQAQRRPDLKFLYENKEKIIKCSSTSGHKHALNEVLSNQAIMAKLSDTKASKEVRAFDDFNKTLNDDPDRAFYSWMHVQRANESGAIKTLMVTDELFRASDIKTRRLSISCLLLLYI